MGTVILALSAYATQHAHTHIQHPQLPSPSQLRFYLFASASLLYWIVLSDHSTRESARAGAARVEFTPHEAEIRAFLWKAAPGELHRVDSWLKEYRGQEAMLMAMLRREYEGGPPPA